MSWKEARYPREACLSYQEQQLQWQRAPFDLDGYQCLQGNLMTVHQQSNMYTSNCYIFIFILCSFPHNMHFPSVSLPFVSLSIYYCAFLKGISRFCDNIMKISTLGTRVLIDELFYRITPQFSVCVSARSSNFPRMAFTRACGERCICTPILPPLI